MSIKIEKIMIVNLEIDVIWKDIKNMYLVVYLFNGRIKILVFVIVDEEVVCLFVILKLSWIKKYVKNFRE